MAPIATGGRVYSSWKLFGGLLSTPLPPLRHRRPPKPEADARWRSWPGERSTQLGDQTATVEERAHRKRRLIKGPNEFRDVRGDQPKKKG